MLDKFSCINSPDNIFTKWGGEERLGCYVDVIAKFSWMNRLPNYLGNGAPLTCALRVRACGAPL